MAPSSGFHLGGTLLPPLLLAALLLLRSTSAIREELSLDDMELETSGGETATTPVLQFQMYRAGQSEWPAENSDRQRSRNFANAAGVLRYIHNEVVGRNVAAKAKPPDCQRKYNIDRIYRYKVTMRSTPEAILQFASGFLDFVAMDKGKCTVPHCADTWWKPYGYVPGCQEQNVDVFHYPDAVWYSFPGRCPSKAQPSTCSAEEEHQEPGGACRPSGTSGLVPSGTWNCSYIYEPEGYISLDELVGIRGGYKHFCEQGGVEFNGPNDDESGVTINFWKNYTDVERNKERINALLLSFSQKYPEVPLLDDPTCRKVWVRPSYWPSKPQESDPGDPELGNPPPTSTPAATAKVSPHALTTTAPVPAPAENTTDAGVPAKPTKPTEKPPTPAPNAPLTAPPTAQPTPAPTPAPTASPTLAPTPSPAPAPKSPLTLAPTSSPTLVPTSPSPPTLAPTSPPIIAPTSPPTPAPTSPSTPAPTSPPTPAPRSPATPVPTPLPTAAPTPPPMPAPTRPPTPVPTSPPTSLPTATPTQPPTPAPTQPPVPAPTSPPTPAPTPGPTPTPTPAPAAAPTSRPTSAPTPTPLPTAAPTSPLTPAPTAPPTSAPTSRPTPAPVSPLTAPPTAAPTAQPSARPSPSPTQAPAGTLTPMPQAVPTAAPTTHTPAVKPQVPAPLTTSAPSTSDAGKHNSTVVSTTASGPRPSPVPVPEPVNFTLESLNANMTESMDSSTKERMNTTMAPTTKQENVTQPPEAKAITTGLPSTTATSAKNAACRWRSVCWVAWPLCLLASLAGQLRGL